MCPVCCDTSLSQLRCMCVHILVVKYLCSLRLKILKKHFRTVLISDSVLYKCFFFTAQFICTMSTVLLMLLQVLGKIGTVMSEDDDSDVRVKVAGHVWIFNAACCTKVLPTAKARHKKCRSESSSDTDDDDDDVDDDDDGDAEQTVLSEFCPLIFFHR